MITLRNLAIISLVNMGLHMYGVFYSIPASNLKTPIKGECVAYQLKNEYVLMSFCHTRLDEIKL